MRLVVISALEHYRTQHGILAGWSTVVREFEYLTKLFEEVRHIAPLHDGPAPAHARRYPPAIEFVPLPPAGGPNLVDKFQILMKTGGYVSKIRQELREADAVYVRCPSNTGLLAAGLLPFLSKPRIRWIKFAGDWRPSRPEPVSHQLQRTWLRYAPHRSQVTVNGPTGTAATHLHSFVNPSFSHGDWLRAYRHVSRKTLSSPVRLVFVGRLSPDKGAMVAAEACIQLRRRGYNTTLDIAGDGQDRRSLLRLASRNPNTISLHGWLSTTQLAKLYERAHFVVLPSRSEGWPKVLSEGMAFRAVPVTSDLSAIREVLFANDCGTTCKGRFAKNYADAIAALIGDPSRWSRLAENAHLAAAQFTYERYIAGVAQMLGLPEPCSPSRISDAA